MKTMRKLLIIPAAAILLFVIAISVSGAANFKDVQEGDWFYESVTSLANLGVIDGYEGDVFLPENSITRAEFVKVLAVLSKDNLAGYTTDVFSDVNGDDWFMSYVAWAVEKDITKGTGGQFEPDVNISREQIATMILRYAKNISKTTLPEKLPAIEFKDQTQISEWAREGVTTMQRAGIIQGHDDGRFAPLDYAKRAEAAEMVWKYVAVLSGDDPEWTAEMEAKSLDGIARDGDIFLPARAALTNMGFELTYYYKTGLLLADDGNTDILCWAARTTAYVDGRKMETTGAAFNDNGTMWIPVSLLKATGGTVVTKEIDDGIFRVYVKQLTYDQTSKEGLPRSGQAFYGTTREGSVTIYDGRTAEGSLANGIGDIKSGSGTYHGTVNDSKFEKGGSYVGSLGIRYYGEWYNGYLNGSGRMIYPNGEACVGIFTSGQFTSGTYYMVDGSTFEGTFHPSNKYPQQTGTYTDANGKVTSGNWGDYGAIKP